MQSVLLLLVLAAALVAFYNPQRECLCVCVQRSAIDSIAHYIIYYTSCSSSSSTTIFCLSSNLTDCCFCCCLLVISAWAMDAAALVPSEYNRSESCSRLESPPNGDLNCLSWTWGQMCRPSCSVGHVFFRPLPSAVYLCGRDRRWKPGTSVPDCARKYFFIFTLARRHLRSDDEASANITSTFTDQLYNALPIPSHPAPLRRREILFHKS